MIANAPANWKSWIETLSNQLHARSRWRLTVIMIGMIWATGRKTVTSWLRGAEIGQGFQEFYYFIASLGKKSTAVAEALLGIVISQLLGGVPRIVAAIDDTPTRRYGPKVEGAGIHHDGVTKPTDQTLLYGHLWVTLALLVQHSRFGTMALPLLAKLYIRACDVFKLQDKYAWQFKTKLQLAAELVQWLYSFCHRLGTELWIVFDGGYTRRNFLKKIPKQVICVGRLRADAALRDLPPPRRPGQRGAPRKYGLHKISLPKRAGQKRGWQKGVVKGKQCKYKAFVATYRHLQGKILVVLVCYRDGSWAAFFCSNPDANPLDVLKIVSDRWAIEENFHDLKQYLGAGEQQVRNLWANIGCWHLCLWMLVLTHLWSWNLSDNDLVDRSLSPWDSQARRPSINDRLRALRRVLLGLGIIDINKRKPKLAIIRKAFKTLYRAVC